MGEQDVFIQSVANTIATYRLGEIKKPDAEHVNKWLSQFTQDQQLPFIREFDHVMKACFITEQNVELFLTNLIKNTHFTGPDIRSYWKRANLLNIQKDGVSQREMLKILDRVLLATCGFGVKDCGSPNGDYIYIDDFIFSGGRVGTDLEHWFKNVAPQNGRMRFVVIGYHTLGQYQVSKRINSLLIKAGKSFSFDFWRSCEIENRKYHKNISGVLWPTSIPNDPAVLKYIAEPHKFPFEPRSASGQMGYFSSEEGRHVLEQEFLIAGAKIRGLSNVSAVNRPLGHSFYGVGFGATMVTYRNCPNNCPLAMWWGEATPTSTALQWYPLLPRKNYSSAENVFAKLFG